MDTRKASEIIEQSRSLQWEMTSLVEQLQASHIRMRNLCDMMKKKRLLLHSALSTINTSDVKNQRVC